jgi:hypothetical protein
LGPRISRVEESFAKKYGWTPARSSRVWENNPAYAEHAAEAAQIAIGKPLAGAGQAN